MLKTEKILALGLLAAMVGFGIWGHFNLPDAPIAVHFGIDGVANGFMPRDQALAIMPAIILVAALLLLWIFPARMPKNASIERSAGSYGSVTLAVLGFLTVIHIALILGAGGLDLDHMKLTLVGAGLVFIIMGNYLPKTRKNWLMGIRSPWTLSDERVWDKTHRLAGPLFMLGGAGVIADAFFVPVAERMTVLIVAVMVPAIVSYGYSYLAARKLDLV